ncbi:hypothetical protein GP486_000001 [Trichoglossum hirsutum]|uniref:Uncharacterized protein n=1 Tax=Trichoglossum hirsutum TaxID=265104 RepID=A0A9P8LJA8_9PEZI|nr:hypothetical protein GP486_000001 [Trichoglossum hirsutum]
MAQGETVNERYQEHQLMYRVPFDLGPPRLATDIAYPSSSPALGATEVFTPGDAPRDRPELDNKFLDRLNKWLRQQSNSAADTQKEGQPLEISPPPTQAQLQDQQNTEHISSVTTTPTEVKLQETQGKSSPEGLPDMSIAPTQVRLEEARVRLSQTAEYTVLSPLPQLGSITENTHYECAPRTHSRPGQTPSRVAPKAPGGRSNFHNPKSTVRTKDANIPKPPVKQPQINATGVAMYFCSMEEAEKAMNEHLNWSATNDETAPRTDEEKSLLVMELFLAMTDTSLAPEVEEGTKKPQAIRTFEEGSMVPFPQYRDSKTLTSVTAKQEMCIQRQRLGALVPPWQQVRKPKEYESFKLRFKATCEALRREKQLCKRLMAACLLDDFVDDPSSYVKRIQQNKSLNDKKKDQIKLGRAAQAAAIPNVMKRQGRKRKVTDVYEVIEGGRKRTRRTKVETELHGDIPLAESLQATGSSQPFFPPLNFDNFPPLDPALTQDDTHNEEWLGWINYDGAFLSEEAPYAPDIFDPTQVANGEVFQPHTLFHTDMNYQPATTNSALSGTGEQALTDQHDERPDDLSHHHVPHYQGFSEEESQQVKSGRKRRKIAKD